MGQIITKEINSKLDVYRSGRIKTPTDLLIDRCRHQHEDIYSKYMDGDTPS